MYIGQTLHTYSKLPTGKHPQIIPRTSWDLSFYKQSCRLLCMTIYKRTSYTGIGIDPFQVCLRFLISCSSWSTTTDWERLCPVLLHYLKHCLSLLGLDLNQIVFKIHLNALPFNNLSGERRSPHCTCQHPKNVYIVRSYNIIKLLNFYPLYVSDTRIIHV